MATAYRCDWCESFSEGRPHKHLAVGPTMAGAMSRAKSGDEANWELCEGCWHAIIELRESRGEHES